MRIDYIKKLAILGIAAVISAVFWFLSAIEIGNYFFEYVKSNYSETQYGNIYFWISVATGGWAMYILLSDEEYFNRRMRDIFCILIWCAVFGIIFQAAGSAFFLILPIRMPEIIRIPAILALLFFEVPIVGFITTRHMKKWRAEGFVLGTLKALNFSLSGLATVKVAALLILPGIHIRFSLPLILP